MTLREAVDRYVAWQRDHGAKFRSSAETLDTFCRQAGENRDCDTVGEDEIRRFLAGKGVLTRTRAVKYGTLAGFYSFAVSRGHVSCIPMPPRGAGRQRPEDTRHSSSPGCGVECVGFHDKPHRRWRNGR